MRNRYNDIASALAALEAGEITATTLVEEHLDRLDASEEKLHAMITPLRERALEQALAIDTARQAGDPLGPLAGIPFTVKDMFLLRGTRTTAASQILKDFEAPYTATAIARLEEAGAICIAKLNLDEFAQGGSTEFSSYGPTHNPRDLTRVPGGTSGGSAAAVAAGIGYFSIGTDTGGSIRQPAAYCGVVGMKPTYGLVSRYGVVAVVSSFDTIGPLARTVEDATIVLSIMAGQDEHDATTLQLTTDHFDIHRNQLEQPRIAIIKEYMEGLSGHMLETYEEVFATLRDAGWRIDSVELPHIGLALPAYYILNPAEISSNLERYDGIRYGSSAAIDASVVHDLMSTYTQTRGTYFGPELLRRIMTGTYVLSAGYYEAYYKKAMQVRTLIRDDFENVFESYDVVIGPTTPTPAFKLGEHTSDPVAMYLEDIMTVAANLAGIPALSLPLEGPDGLPVGLQLMAGQKCESTLLSVAADAEKILNTSLAEVQL